MSEATSIALYRHPVLRTGLMAVGALFLYGGWALFANMGHGWTAAWVAAGTQGGISFVTTLVLTGFMEWVSRRADRLWLKFALPFTSATSVAAIATISIHMVMGTPALWATVAAPLLIGTIYSAIYAANLVREAAAA
ncbi:MAG: hypothetical protein ACI9MC_000696 [Kiritimatiellia bacterium]|jgi:hypothetical protein